MSRFLIGTKTLDGIPAFKLHYMFKDGSLRAYYLHADGREAETYITVSMDQFYRWVDDGMEAYKNYCLAVQEYMFREEELDESSY